MKIFAASAGGLRPKDTRGHFFLPEEGGFGAFSVSSARGFLCGRSALKYKRENRNFLYQTFLFRFLGFCLHGFACFVSGWSCELTDQRVSAPARTSSHNPPPQHFSKAFSHGVRTTGKRQGSPHFAATAIKKCRRAGFQNKQSGMINDKRNSDRIQRN